MRRLQPIQAGTQQSADRDELLLHTADGAECFGPWLTSKQACLYIPCPTRNAFYQWCHRHGIVRRNNGTIARADIDRVLTRKRKRRVMAPASLANLQRKRVV